MIMMISYLVGDMMCAALRFSKHLTNSRSSACCMIAPLKSCHDDVGDAGGPLSLERNERAGLAGRGE